MSAADDIQLQLDASPALMAVRSSAWLGESVASDVVYTPLWAARDIVEWFKPSGAILEPSKGGGAFMQYLPPETEWCEIQEGRDFYSWSKRVDWIIGNPPYSGIPTWLRHSFKLADNIAYLIPLRSVFLGPQLIRDIYAWGGIKHMRHYGGGNKLGFPFGNAIGALHFQRGWSGPMDVSHYSPNKVLYESLKS